MHVDLAAMCLNEAAGNRQTKARATLLPCNAVVNLLELVEDSALIGGGNARTGVLDRDLEMLVLDLDPNLDESLVREFDRVSHDVEQDLSKTPFVAVADGQVR